MSAGIEYEKASAWLQWFGRNWIFESIAFLKYIHLHDEQEELQCF